MVAVLENFFIDFIYFQFADIIDLCQSRATFKCLVIYKVDVVMENNSIQTFTVRESILTDYLILIRDLKISKSLFFKSVFTYYLAGKSACKFMSTINIEVSNLFRKSCEFTILRISLYDLCIKVFVKAYLCKHKAKVRYWILGISPVFDPADFKLKISVFAI